MKICYELLLFYYFVVSNKFGNQCNIAFIKFYKKAFDMTGSWATTSEITANRLTNKTPA